MTKLRGYIPTMLMLVTLIFGATAANAGIIVNGRTANTASTTSDPCTESESLFGIIVNGFAAAASFAKTGIIVNGRTGIIVNGATGSNDTCGIIVNG
ncbi:MAG: hypothetical protein ABIR33_10285 [Pyrinomonadaceae bacterium]